MKPIKPLYLWRGLIKRRVEFQAYILSHLHLNSVVDCLPSAVCRLPTWLEACVYRCDIEQYEHAPRSSDPCYIPALALPHTRQISRFRYRRPSNFGTIFNARAICLEICRHMAKMCFRHMFANSLQLVSASRGNSVIRAGYEMPPKQPIDLFKLMVPFGVETGPSTLAATEPRNWLSAVRSPLRCKRIQHIGLDVLK